MPTPEPGITGDDGAALAFGDDGAPGGAAVESCKGRCGGCDEPTGCCICVDVDATEGLCRPFYATPPEKWCNPVKTCCCGTRVRVTWTRTGRYFKRTETPGVGFKQNDGTWDEKAVFELAVKYNGDQCIGIERTDLEYSLRNYNHIATEDGEDETLLENFDPKSIAGFLKGAMGDAKTLCRPEPVELAVALLGGGNSPYGPIWSAIFQSDGCSGERRVEDAEPPNTSLNITRWRSSSACRMLGLTAEIDNEFETPFSSGTEDVAQTVTMMLEVLEDECCPPEGGGPYVEPGNPGENGYGGFVGGVGAGAGGGLAFCGRCGAVRAGRRCAQCGFVCWGCGE